MITFLRKICGAAGMFEKGATHSLDPRFEEALVEAGAAEYVGDAPVAEPEVETAEAAPAPEAAVAKPSRKRGKK